MPSPSDRDPKVVTGRIIKPYGLLGWLRVEPRTSNPQRFQPGNTFLLEGREKGERLVLEAVQEAGGDLRVKFQGLENREEAGKLAGKLLLVTPAELGESPEDSFWEHQLLGLRVETLEGRRLGEVEEVMETGANDVLVLSGDREYLIPMIADVVVRVDLDAGVIIIRPLPGLLEE